MLLVAYFLNRAIKSNVCVRRENQFNQTMDSLNRNLLLLNKKEELHPEEFKREISFLSRVLDSSEAVRNFYNATEVIDINRYKIINKQFLIEKLATEKYIRPFIFFYIKN